MQVIQCESPEYAFYVSQTYSIKEKKGMCFAGMKHIPPHERNVLYAVVREKKQKLYLVWEGSRGVIFSVCFPMLLLVIVCVATLNLTCMDAPTLLLFKVYSYIHLYLFSYGQETELVLLY